MLKRGINLEMLNFVVGLMAGVILGVAGLGLVLLAWVIKLVQQKGE